jgi:hypothetical protein
MQTSASAMGELLSHRESVRANGRSVPWHGSCWANEVPMKNKRPSTLTTTKKSPTDSKLFKPRPAPSRPPVSARVDVVVADLSRDSRCK